MSSSLLIDENPVLFQPSLARILGVPGAIVTQQLHFLLNLPRSGKMIDGERWIYNTYEDWQRDHFPFWSIRTIQRTFLLLEKGFVIETKQPEKRHSRRKYYRLNRGLVAKLIAANVPPMPEGDILEPSDDDDKLAPSGKTTNWHDGTGQTGAFLITETSAETTPETSKADEIETKPIKTSPPKAKRTSAAPRNFALPPRLALIGPDWDRWQQHLREKGKPLTPTTAEGQIELLAGMETGKAIESIRASINAGWTALYPPRKAPAKEHEGPAFCRL